MFSNPIPKQYRRGILLNAVAFPTLLYINHLSNIAPDDITTFQNIAGGVSAMMLFATIGYELYKQLTEKPPADTLNPNFVAALGRNGAQALRVPDTHKASKTWTAAPAA